MEAKYFTIESMYGDVVKRLYPASKRIESVRIDMIPEGCILYERIFLIRRRAIELVFSLLKDKVSRYLYVSPTTRVIMLNKIILH